MNDRLSADLIPQFFDHKVSIVVLKFVRSQMSVRADMDPPMEVGKATFEVVEVLRGEELKAGAILDMPAHRIADRNVRLQNNLDRWNVLPLEPGRQFLFACAPDASPGTWKGLAAKPVDGPSSPEVAAARRCLAIEGFTGDPSQRIDLVRKALVDKHDMVSAYAIALLAKGELLPIADAAGLVANAMASGETDREQKLRLANSLTSRPFFNAADKAEGANPIVITALASGLATETDASRRQRWVQYLASCVLSEFSPEPARNLSIRGALLRRVPESLSAAVERILAESSPRMTGDEKEIAEKLRSTWRAALASQ